MKPTTGHHQDCPFEYAWDVAREVGAYCSCPKGWPRKVCNECWVGWTRRHDCRKMKRRVVWIHFNAHEDYPNVWTVRTKGKDIYTPSIVVDIPLTTIYRGKDGRQPKAYLRGVGTVTVTKNEVRID